MISCRDRLARARLIIGLVAAAHPAIAWAAQPDTKPPSKPPPAASDKQVLPADDAQERQLLRVAGEGFTVRRTPHFVIAFNADPGLVDSLSTRLEQTYASVDRFCRQSGFAVRPLKQRLEVLFFDTWPDYERYGRRLQFNCAGTYGFYYEGTNRSAFFNVENDPQLIKMQASIVSARENVARMEETLKSIRGNQPIEITYSDGRRLRVTKAQAKEHLESARRDLKKLDGQRQIYCDRINRTVLQHELAHQVSYNTGVHVRGAANPKWLVEGLACMFETPPNAGSSGSGIATINQARLKDFRQAVVGDADRASPTSEMYAAAVAAGRMTVVTDLIRDPDLFEERGERGATHYAAAWALVHYLHRTQNKALPGYLKDVASRRPGAEWSADEEWDLFVRHFGVVDDAWTGRFSSYILRLPYRSTPGDFQ
ncbi:MAG: DUF1570 domain-containing protein [Planctomycetes bacterium]|nr:DUF1570 domain-containing protein [Planctomycetota bacterium]